MVQNKSIIFNEVPVGEPVVGQTLKVVSEEFNLDQNLPEGSAIVKTLTLSLDPYQRGRMRPEEIKSYVPAFSLGKPIDNAGVARVLKSNNADLKENDLVYGALPFSEYAVIGSKGFANVTNSPASPQTLVGALGMPGRTAFASLEALVELKKGEAIFVSAASGAVGALVVQISKLKGLKVLASAGSDEKVKFCKEIGADHAFNYKTADTREEIKKFGPIHIFYDNVGGSTLEAVLDTIEDYGRIISCGAISQYNATEAYGIKNTFQIVAKKLTIKGFIVFYLQNQPSKNPEFSGKTIEDEFLSTMPKLVTDGTIKVKEHVYDGLDSTPGAFNDLLKGKNFGKVVIKLE